MSDLKAMISLAEDGSPPRATIYDVRAGDTILLNAKVYRVDSLTFDEAGREKIRADGAKGLVGLQKHDCVTAHEETNPIFKSQKNAFVLQKRPGSISFRRSPQLAVTVFLDDVSQDANGHRTATITWQSGPWNSWANVRLGQNAGDLPDHRTTLTENDTFALPGAGRLKAIRIIPEGPHQPAWLVMRPEDNEPQP